jgi:hypothetical protein
MLPRLWLEASSQVLREYPEKEPNCRGESSESGRFHRHLGIGRRRGVIFCQRR